MLASLSVITNLGNRGVASIRNKPSFLTISLLGLKLGHGINLKLDMTKQNLATNLSGYVQAELMPNGHKWPDLVGPIATSNH